MQETEVQIETITEKHVTEKRIIRVLICSNHYYDLICNKSSCKICDFLIVGNIILLSGLSKEEKISEFQKHCRNYYQNFLWLHFYLKGRTVLVKEKEEKNGDNK